MAEVPTSTAAACRHRRGVCDANSAKIRDRRDDPGKASVPRSWGTSEMDLAYREGGRQAVARIWTVIGVPACPF